MFGLVDGIKSDIFMAALVVGWSTILLVTWKRKANEYLYKWGNFDVKVSSNLVFL